MTAWLAWIHFFIKVHDFLLVGACVDLLPAPHVLPGPGLGDGEGADPRARHVVPEADRRLVPLLGHHGPVLGAAHPRLLPAQVGE